jgi:hypothetical protein
MNRIDMVGERRAGEIQLAVTLLLAMMGRAKREIKETQIK